MDEDALVRLKLIANLLSDSVEPYAFSSVIASGPRGEPTQPTSHIAPRYARSRFPFFDQLPRFGGAIFVVFKFIIDSPDHENILGTRSGGAFNNNAAERTSKGEG
ncbi:hypothetical protein [Rhizobium sp. NLR22b]|uniref:hypothetical protein n=1 Tax=Rhizobium sp. NLR22b TaxID=2731115 RepID=UPI00287FCFAF|nr:hypothetical protein [Rhizobium sp. NLR22b]